MPNHVLTGFPSTAFGGLVDAGMAVGWLHLAAAFVKRSFLGKAWLTVSTFDLTSPQAARESARAPSSQGAGGELSGANSPGAHACASPADPCRAGSPPAPPLPAEGPPR